MPLTIMINNFRPCLTLTLVASQTSQTAGCSCSVIDVFQLKIHWDETELYICVCKLILVFILCSIWLELYTHFTSGSLQTEHLTNGISAKS
jgi:hypothetical protein